MRETLQLLLGSACGKDIEMFAIAPLRTHHRKVSLRYYSIYLELLQVHPSVIKWLLSVSSHFLKLIRNLVRYTRKQFCENTFGFKSSLKVEA